MTGSERLGCSIALALAVAALALRSAAAAPIPRQAPPPEVDVRLHTAVSSRSPVGTPVEAVTISSPLEANPALGAGCLLTGSVVVPRSTRGNRAALRINFDRARGLNGREVPVRAQVVSMDNVRETVTRDGLIVGVAPIRALPPKKEDLLLLLAYAHPFLIAAAEGVQLVRHEGDRPEIAFAAGTELRLRLDADTDGQPLECEAPAAPELPLDLRLLDQAPNWLTRTKAGSRPADWLNVAFVGPRSTLEQGFAAAGWMAADRGSLRADVKMFLAVAEREGYRSGPVSLLTLGGAAPDLVFEKENNTYSRRHHVRIWETSFAYGGEPVWLAAASHDISIKFTTDGTRFTHRIDGNIDAERAKVVGDFVFTGSARGYTLLDRATVPSVSRNAGGDIIRTDGRLAVVMMQPDAPR